MIPSKEPKMPSVFQAILLPVAVGLLFVATGSGATKTLQIYFIDVEGGQATLLVAPSGESVLVDAGWPGNNDRDADRIAEAVKSAGLKQIDYLLITHYHTDHVGGVPQLLKKVKVNAFVDHGPNLENDELAPEGYDAYLKNLGSAKRITAKPGDSIPVEGIKVEVLAAAGAHITQPAAGAGQPNPYCASEPKWPADHTENAASVGILVTFGDFRFVDLGDLTKDQELHLVCPNNLIGTADLFLVSHHGMGLSNSKCLVHALHPRAAIMENGAQKGNDPKAWQTVHDSPGLQDLWQLHYSSASGADHNVSNNAIANLDGDADGHYLKVTAQSDGTFSVVNSRNKYERIYKD
jgi:beta-lactamase superfamily II metal-dependent hydrolase